MNASRSPLRRIAALAALAAVVLAMAGCSKNVTVDPGYTSPEGRYDANARLIVYGDVPIDYTSYLDIMPPGPDPTDSLLGQGQVDVLPGARMGLILDGTPASGYQVLRRESNGGFAPLQDFVVTPAAKFLDSQWEAYPFQDLHPSGFTPPTYLGRGMVQGEITRTSPLTNLGELTLSRPVPIVIPYPVTDSTMGGPGGLRWKQVPGATGYWLQIYQYKGGALQQFYASAPAPMVTSQVRTYHVAYIPATPTANDSINYQIGMPGVLVLTNRVIVNNVDYLVRVSAVNAQGEMIGFTYGDRVFLAGYRDPYTADNAAYFVYQQGAFLAHPM